MTIITKELGNREMPFDEARLRGFISRVGKVTTKEFEDKVVQEISAMDVFKAEEITQLLINQAVGEMNEGDPLNSTYVKIASNFFMHRLYKEASQNRSYDASEKYGDYYSLLKTLAGKGIDSKNILEKYSKEEIHEIADIIEPEKDELLDYAGAKSLASRYLTSGFAKETLELPQERWLTISTFLMQSEAPEERIEHIKEAYWALSNLYMTVATPTLTNAGKKTGQLSSCFIDSVGDSLQGIYDSNTDVANLSKFGGGIGVYMGKVRSSGSDIRGYKNASSGVLPWIKQLNNTAVSVDQLGVRSGALAVYLDVWHKDIFTFLDLRLNNGDPRKRAQDIFLGVCLPDLFMEKVDQRSDWHLFDPHEVQTVMGFAVEDFYDEKRGEGSFRTKYEECVRNPLLSREIVPAIDIMKRIMRSQLETGVPFMFYRDEVNRQNPNKHAGMIYSSNLCTEIFQNQSPTIQKSVKIKEVDGEVLIVTEKKPGDFVVCNLSSINLGKAYTDGVLGRLIRIMVRMLDNVVQLNELPIPQAELTSNKYRAIGLGTFGWHHLLALKNIQWESEEAVQFADKLYEEIAFLTIQASADLAKEKGSYPAFEGSEWQTGEYFERKGYFEQENSEEWKKLHEQIKESGIRNGYLMAVAPNVSTSVIAGSTASVDPIFKPYFVDEKKSSKLPIVAPDLDHNTYNVYRRSAYMLDQRWTIKQNAARVRHVDQGVSLNLYVPKSIKASVLLKLHMQAWDSGLKTTYYVRSTAVDIKECEWCES